MSEDYYKILGVDKSANKDEIKRAYRRLAHQYHPDKNSGDDKKFKEINEAYQVLSNDQKRQQYDQFSAFAGGFGGQGSFNWDDMFSSYGGQQGFYGRRINLEDLFSEVFGDFFGGGFTRRKPKRKNIIVDMEINLEDILKGIEKEIKINDLNIKLKIKAKAAKELLKEIKKLIKKTKKG